MRKLLLLLGLVVGLAGATGAGAATTTITITKTGFHGTTVGVAVGDSVTWVNKDTVNHQVIADAGAFTSPVLKPGQSFTYTFTKADAYPYRDKLNEKLRGRVIANAHNEITVTQTGFLPTTLSVASGDTVTWTNHDTNGGSHQIVANDGSFSSPTLKPGASYSHTFDTAGSVSYHDALHASFTGSVTVIAGPPLLLTLHATRSTLVAGGSTTLLGTVSKAGETVSIVAQPVGQSERTVTVTAGADGSFSLVVRPQIGTTYQAMVKSAQTGTVQASSSTVSVGVHPRVTLRRVGKGRFSSIVLDANAVGGHWVYLTRFVAHRGYRTVARARLRESANGSVFTAPFRMNLRHQKLRVFLPASQAGPGYLVGYSNVVVS